MSRKNHVKCLFLLVSALVASLHANADEPLRTMGVRAGPEKVFSRPVEAILPDLKGATATRVNGRVGMELVFWGYQLNSGKTVQLFACMKLEGVNCEARIPRICRNGMGTVLNSVTEPGDVVKRACEVIAHATVGELHPGCTDTEMSNNLQVGLVSCPGS